MGLDVGERNGSCAVGSGLRGLRGSAALGVRRPLLLLLLPLLLLPLLLLPLLLLLLLLLLLADAHAHHHVGVLALGEELLEPGGELLDMEMRVRGGRSASRSIG